VNHGVSRWTELDDGVFAATYPFLSLTVGAVVGDEGVLLVDTRSTPEEAAELGRDLVALTSRPVRWVVNTHWHWDHCWGNAVFAHAECWGHELTRSVLIERGEAMRSQAREWFPPERLPELDEVEIRPPDHTFADRVSLDIGRTVELGHYGRGHTDGDVTVAVGHVLFAGDLVEESGPPAFEDAHPAVALTAEDFAADRLRAAFRRVLGGVQAESLTAAEEGQARAIINPKMIIRAPTEQGRGQLMFRPPASVPEDVL
jgi:glyoxylase-like metal-dependent hydrolase (beta-lactamase superfamily II)